MDMDNLGAETVSIPRSEVIAVSRLLWDIGSQDGTSHQHKIDCFSWGGVLDNRAGLPPWPTSGEPMQEVIAFYEGVRRHLDDVLRELRSGDGG
jgi:hypothetical protein